jgi:hypothetical protein
LSLLPVPSNWSFLPASGWKRPFQRFPKPDAGVFLPAYAIPPNPPLSLTTGNTVLSSLQRRASLQIFALAKPNILIP